MPNACKNFGSSLCMMCHSQAISIILQAQDKYFNVDISVQAPVFLLPLNESTNQALMVDLGSFSVKNTLLAPDQEHSIDAFGVKLDAFKVSR